MNYRTSVQIYSQQEKLFVNAVAKRNRCMFLPLPALFPGLLQRGKVLSIA